MSKRKELVERLELAQISSPITGYYVFRRIDDIGLQKRIINQGQIPEERQAIISDLNGRSIEVRKTIANSPIYCLEGRSYLVSSALSAQDLPPGTWEVVGSVPAHEEDQYICLVPTLADSSSNLIYSVYCISAETTTPSVFYFSPSDSGYSIDNIAPSAPLTLNATQVGNHSVELLWNSNRTDHDWHYFAVHRSLMDDFTPDSSSFLANTTDTVFMDSSPLDSVLSHYKVVSYDVHENPSAPSLQATIFFDSTVPISVKDNSIPIDFKLTQNYPNPFNAVTNIRYSLPYDCHVVLEIWNLQGQKVATLIDGKQQAGYKYARWNANSFASGIYFYRLKAENFVQTKRMQLMK